MKNSQIAQAVEKSLCKASLYHFLKIGWSTVDPSTYVDDWHVKILCNELERFYRGEIKKLIINIPPRCLKSTICCVFFPVWCWLQDPAIKLLTGSHAQTLSTRDTVKSRYLIQSDWFQSLWGDEFQFKADQNQKTFYSNNYQGERMSFSVGGAITGSGGDIIIVDDPIDAKNPDSETIRESVNRWFSEALSTRFNDPQTGRMLVIMQRLHQYDLTGYILDTEGDAYTHICLPMRYEGNKTPYERRKKEGEILTTRHDEKSLKSLETSLGSYGTASQLQQRPAPREGGYIKLRWLNNRYTELPKVKMWHWSWDTAVKEGQHNDFSVGQLWAECENGYYIVDLVRLKMEYPELKTKVKDCYVQQKTSEVLVEDKSSGQQIVQDLKRYTKIPVKPMMPGKDMPKSKEERVILVSPLFEAGKVFLPSNKKWVSLFIDEVTNFPNAQHDDTVDSMTMYLARKLSKTEPRVRQI